MKVCKTELEKKYIKGEAQIMFAISKPSSHKSAFCHTSLAMHGTFLYTCIDQLNYSYGCKLLFTSTNPSQRRVGQVNAGTETTV